MSQFKGKKGEVRLVFKLLVATGVNFCKLGERASGETRGLILRCEALSGKLG